MNKMNEQARTRRPEGLRPSGRLGRPASAKGKFSSRPHFVQMLKKRIAMPRERRNFFEVSFFQAFSLAKNTVRYRAFMGNARAYEVSGIQQFYIR